MQASSTGKPKTIEIGSSSAIYDFNMDEDSYDPSYLKAETQSQSQDSVQVNQKATSTVPTKASTSPICEAEEDSDDEFPDAIQVIRDRNEREKKAKALQAKKAALLARQQEKMEQHKPKEDLKGKGREIVMDLDSDPEELEIEIPRASTPVVKADHHSPRSHKLMRRLALKPVKKEHDDDMSESQFKRAGRTFHHGDENVVVNPHVATKASKARSTKKGEHAVTTHGVYNLLMEKAKQQALNDKVKRMEDWKRRGGTLRHDYGTEELMRAEDEEGQDDRAKDLMNAIQARIIETPQDDDEEDEDDEDYIGSDEEAAYLSGEEDGSVHDEDEEPLASSDGEDGKAINNANVSASVQDRFAHRASDDPDLAGDMSSIATTQVIPSDRSDVSDAESEEAIVVSIRAKPTERLVLQAQESQDDGAALAGSGDNAHPNQDPVQATQYHGFVVKDAAPAFPEFGKIDDISLTQAFGKVGATQAPPQASKAVFDDGDGFSQMFGDDDAGGFTQATLPTQTGAGPKANAPMPSVSEMVTVNTPLSSADRVLFGKMFRKGSDSSPEVQRHAFGEAPMLLDAALRDAQIREEAERAYDQIHFDRSRSVGERYVNIRYRATTQQF